MVDIDVENYFPEHIKTIEEYIQIAKAYNKELQILWEATDKELRNQHVLTCDADGIAYYENFLGITPGTTDSLDTRRYRVYNKLNSHIVYNLSTFIKQVEEIFSQIIIEPRFEITNNRLYTDYPDLFQVKNNRLYVDSEIASSFVVKNNRIYFSAYSGLISKLRRTSGKVVRNPVIETTDDGVTLANDAAKQAYEIVDGAAVLKDGYIVVEDNFSTGYTMKITGRFLDAEKLTQLEEMVEQWLPDNLVIVISNIA